jgi:hypothetical protein
MKTENLTKAVQTFSMFESELREAHTDAIHSGNEFAEIVLYDMIERAAELRLHLRRAAVAAKVETGEL